MPFKAILMDIDMSTADIKPKIIVKTKLNIKLNNKILPMLIDIVKHDHLINKITQRHSKKREFKRKMYYPCFIKENKGGRPF